MNTLYDSGRGGWVDYDSEPYGASIVPVATSVIHAGDIVVDTSVTQPQSPSLNALNSSSEAPVILSLDEHSTINHDQIR